MVERTSRLRLIIDSSDARDASRDLDRYGDEADRAGRETDQLRSSSDRAGRSMRGLANAARALVAALAVREVLQFADGFQQAQNRLRLVTDSTQELIRVQGELQSIAQSSFNTFSGTADLYSRLARSTEELGISSERLLSITETVNQAVALSGTSAQAAQAALFQLGQGLGAGALRGEELNSVLEQTPELARAIADGLGVSIAKLRELGADGELTAEKVIGALEEQAEAVNSEFQRLEPTIGQVGTVIREAFANALVEEFVDDLSDAGLDVLELREAFATLGSVVGQVFSGAIQALTEFADIIEEVAFQLERVGAIKPEIKFDPESVEQVRKALLQIETQIEAQQSRLITGGFQFNARGLVDPRSTQGQAIQGEIESLRSQAEELRGILTNSVTPAAKDFARDVSDITDAIGDAQNPIEALGREAEKASDRLKRLDVDQGIGAGAARDFAVGRGGGNLRQERELFAQAIEDALKSRGFSAQEIGRAVAEETAKFTRDRLGELTERVETGRSGSPGTSSRDVSRGIFDSGLLDEVRFVAESVTQGFDQAGFGFDTLTEAFNRVGASIVEKIRDISGGIGDVFSGLGDSLSNVFDGVLGSFGSALSSLGAVGTAVSAGAGLIGSAIDFFKGLFGGRSSNEAGSTFNPSTGGIISALQDGSAADENAKIRDAIIERSSSLIQTVVDLTGGVIRDTIGTSIREDLLQIAVNDRDGIRVARGNDPNQFFFENTEAGAEQAVQRLLSLTIDAIDGGEAALIDYTKAALDAGRGTEQIVEGLQGLGAVLSLTADNLSPVQQTLKQIDDVTNPVVEDLTSLGQSIAGIQAVAQRAARAVGESFVDDLQQDILGFRNATLGEFKRILDEQQQLISDAQALFDRGAITPEEFDLVQVRNALQRQSFFEGLGAEELESLGDFLGLIEGSGGSVAVVLTQLTDAFADFTDNVADTRERLEDEARTLQSAADQIFRSRDNIDLRFPSLSGGELLGDLRGQLANLREQALAGDNTAFERIPDLANRFVELARDLFGSTTQFADQRDFALGVLDQTGGLAQRRAESLLSEIEALNTQVDVLNDIRSALESPDPAVDLIRAQLDQGNIANDLLRQLLEQYIALTQEARAGAITPGEAQGAAEGFFAAGGGATSSGSTVEVEGIRESNLILGQIRAEIRSGNSALVRELRTISNEQKRSRTQSTLVAA